MPRVIDHDERRETILTRAFVVFSQNGYQDTNLSLIAKHCGISRPTLYVYFKNKEEIFYHAIKHMTQGMFQEYKELLEKEEEKELEKLKFICCDILEKSYKKRTFFSYLLDFLLGIKRSGRDYARDFEKRTAGLLYLLSGLVSRGVNRGVFRPLPAKETGRQIFNLMKAFILQMALEDDFVLGEATEIVNTYLDSFLKSSN